LFTLSAVSTGGFSPSDASAGLLSWPAAGVLTVVSLAGALPLILYHNLFRRRGVQAEIGVQARGLLFFALATIALVWLSRLAAQPLSTLADYGRDAFTVFSAQTTAGFSVMDLEGLSAGAKGALIFSMTVGGGVASTAGGIKVLRLLILFHLIRVFIWKAGLPSRAAVPNRLFGRRLQEGEIQEALLIVFLYFAVIFISWLLFLLYDYPPLNALFDVVSAVGTVGLSTGVVGPDTPVVLKGVLIMDMLMGRLEVLALLVLLYPGTWFGRRGSS
jgi:trk system potassium uptake protein TrkH